MRLYISILLVFFSCAIVIAQELTDSLRQQFPEEYYQTYINKAVKENNFSEVAKSYEALGSVLFEKNEKEAAFKAYTKSIHYYGILDDSLNYYRINIQLADYYQQSQLYDDALDIQENALRYFEQEDNYSYQMRLYQKIANIYRIKKYAEKERYYLELCYQTSRQLRDTSFEISSLLQKARLFEDIGKYQKAKESAERASNLSQIIKDTTSLSHAYIRLGLINQLLEKEDLSISFLEQGDTLFQQMPFAFPNYTDYKKISDAFIAFGKPEKAYSYLDIYVAQKDSSTTQIQQNAINDAIAEYQQVLQANEIEALQRAKVDAQVRAEQQRTIIYSFLVSLIAILVGIYFIIRFYQQQISAKEIIVNQKEEINRQRIVDLENNLKIETMQSMLAGQEAERERVAKDLHDSLGGLLSTVKLQFESIETKVNNIATVREYQKANLMLDEACQEVRNISNNMQPGALVKLGLVPALKDLINRFQEAHYPEIDFQHYGVEEKLDNTTALMVFRIIQELLNNSIKYAKAKEVLVQLTKNEKELIVMVEDDGIGYDIEKAKKGMGTENINSRVNYLKGDLSVHSVIGKGTSTMINVPLN